MYATQQLRDEHEAITVLLAVLEHLAVEMREGRLVNQVHLEQLLDLLHTFADTCHHGKEEELLFPALQAAGMPAQGGPVGVMLHEHTVGRAYIRGMTEALVQWHTGHDAVHAFADNAVGYVLLLRAHINKENNILFTMAERILPQAEHERLAGAFEQVEEERIGHGVREQYHTLIHTLQETYLAKAA